MSMQSFTTIFSKCLEILNIKFSVIGFQISLFQFLIFDCVGTIIIGSILYLFHSNE